MSQALYTSMGGINAAQTGINVVANNVANINTTAFKAADVRFQNLFSKTFTTGNSPTATTGGKNPTQIGMGVQVGSIVRNFGEGVYSYTGRNEDLMISGKGYFTLMDTEGTLYYTRDGSFTLDANGDMVNSDGLKVLGAHQLYSTSSSEIPVHVPQTIKTVTSANTDFYDKNVNELNDAQITAGTFFVDVNTDDKGVVRATVTISEADLKDTVEKLTTKIQTQINQAMTDNNSTATVTVTADATTNGKITFANGADTNGMTFVAGTSNFLEATELASAEEVAGVYSSQIMDYKVEVEPVASLTDAVNIKSYSVAEDGTIEATYSNGDKLTVENNPEDKTYQFKYITSLGVVIRGEEVNINPNIAKPENMVIQMGSVVNEAGLVSLNGNLWMAGPNSGDAVFTVGGAMGLGTIQSNGLEASNVDLSRELSNMIISQRAIQANSRVFSTASTIMETLTYLGS